MIVYFHPDKIRLLYVSGALLLSLVSYAKLPGRV